jgi:hypothetical protein
MKKLLTLVSLFVLSICLFSCSKETGKKASDEVCNCAKQVIAKGNKDNIQETLEGIRKCKQDVDKKYEEKLKDEKFKKDFDDALMQCQKEITPKIQALLQSAMPAPQPAPVQPDQNSPKPETVK